MRGFNNSVAEPDGRAIAAAAHVVAGGGIVVYPTETVYGLGADAGSAAALERLVALKGRESGKPIAVLISDLEMLRVVVSAVPPHAQSLMRRFWPGPLTLVLPARAGVSPLLTGTHGGIGVRLSSHPMATALVRELGRPITAPSANPAGRRPPVRIDEARDYFGSQVDYYLDAGPLRGEPASTVVDARDGITVIRAGAIAIEDLRATVTVEGCC
jgi:L-threonylcarbamoyladenylate synthase